MKRDVLCERCDAYALPFAFWVSVLLVFISILWVLDVELYTLIQTAHAYLNLFDIEVKICHNTSFCSPDDKHYFSSTESNFARACTIWFSVLSKSNTFIINRVRCWVPSFLDLNVRGPMCRQICRIH